MRGGGETKYPFGRMLRFGLAGIKGVGEQAAQKILEEREANDPALDAMAGGTGSALSKGGMLTKVQAARRAARSGAHTVIAAGR